MNNTAVAVAEQTETIVVDELVTDQGVYGLYERSKIRPSPDNRKRFNESNLQELAASIKAMGVAQAILIRPVAPTPEAPEEYEIVAGERRWRASGIAGLSHVPALCRKLSDLDAAKIRILENLQREDPHPMEEAEGYQLLMLQHGFSADQLVSEVAKSRAYIYGRLKLCALTSEVREQFLDNKLSASTALLIARIPVPALQVKAANEILAGYGAEPFSHRQAVAHLQARYMLKLSTAVFSITDAKLLAAAGTCTKCPKRTGNQPEIFEGIDANVCTDPDCFAEKRAAHSAALLVQANKQGIPVLEGDEASQTMSRRWNQDSDLVTADMGLWYFRRNAPETKNSGDVKDYLKDDAFPAVATYAKRDDGTLTPLYKRTEIQTALEAVGACETVEAHAARMATAQSNASSSTKTEAERKEREELEKKAEEVKRFRVALYMKLRTRAGTNGFSLQSLREITKVALDEFNLPDELHEAYSFDPNDTRAVTAYIDQAGLPEIQLLLVDALLGNAFDVSYWDIKHGNVDEDDFSTILNIAHHEGIDVNQVREELFPTPIDVTNMQYDHLFDFIKAHPGRINELNDAINASPRGELSALLSVAASNLGYFFEDGRFVRSSEQVVNDAPPAAANVEQSAGAFEDAIAPAEPVSEPAVIDAAEAVDQVAAVGTEPAPAKGTKAKAKAKATPAAGKKPTVAAPKSGKASRKTEAEAVA